MGLDMSLEGSRYRGYNAEKVKIDDFPVQEHKLDMGYWRKHPALHGYIVQNFADGIDECQEIYLSEDDIKTIINAIENDELLFDTTGFFFGASYKPNEENEFGSYAEQKETDLNIFNAALKWLSIEDDGIYRSVNYRASW